MFWFYSFSWSSYANIHTSICYDVNIVKCYHDGYNCELVQQLNSVFFEYNCSFHICSSLLKDFFFILKKSRKTVVVYVNVVFWLWKFTYLWIKTFTPSLLMRNLSLYTPYIWMHIAHLCFAIAMVKTLL